MIRAAEAEAFALKPVTLGLLLKLRRTGQPFPASPLEVYRKGCEVLWTEGSPSRLAATPAAATGAAHVQGSDGGLVPV